MVAVPQTSASESGFQWHKHPARLWVMAPDESFLSAILHSTRRVVMVSLYHIDENGIIP